ncbi:hypothetical protein K461DRAFT_232763 [Myriangium duriaei CBS 260.36]|uniref:Protein CASP n=1 Tax=Myriangium duriaei CBS 260.36 TaxID=1168546 RepID=A0A9P4ITV1_9PEZI|nr:hypothetical protein K461DRAFT_232763 [Myriangium duriaei CBS 260.36]
MSADVQHDNAVAGADTPSDAAGRATPSIGPKVTEADDGNKFQQAIAAWRNLNLTTLVTNLDASASQLVEQQKDTVIQRKDLAQKTKDFRKLDDAGKLTEIKSLLKSYQNFIDLVTNQSKTINSAFLSAYTPLSEAPDPYPLLEASVESLVTSEELVPRLESENKHLQNTVSKLTSQLEDTEAQLEKERSSRQTSENSQDTKIQEVEESWEAVVREKEDNWAAKEKSLEQKVENQERLLKDLKASYEVSQRLEKAGGEDTEAAGRKAASAELEILHSELEKATLRISDVEARNEQLRLDLAQSASKAGSTQKVSVEDDPAFLRLRSENSSLLRKLESARYEKGSEQGKLEGRIKHLERELNALTEDGEMLRGKLDKCSDYDEIKQELEMIRTIEFATGDDADSGDEQGGQSAANGQAKSAKGESLEQLLLARNKKLTDDLTELRVSQKNLHTQLESMEETLSTTNMDLEKSRNLNAQLENDLLEAQHHVSNFDTMSVAGTYTSRYPKSSYAASRRGATSPTSSIISGFDGQRASPSTPTAQGGGSSILPMITAQRDRFKKKLAELENELQKSYTTVSSLRSEVASLQKDNLNLYEKTRYVNSYNRSTALSAYAVGNAVGATGSNNTSSGLSLDRYRSAYESSLSPFAAFRGRESARAFRRMTLPERAIYTIAKTVLATRTSRNLFALYCVALHVLVFYALWFMGSGDIERHAGKMAAVAVAGAAGKEAGKEWRQEGFKEGGR